MKYNLVAIVIIGITFFSCDFRKSVHKNLQTGLTTKGDGLSCSDVYLSDGNNKITETNHIYGQKFFINFENIEGFTNVNGRVYPEMDLYVINEKGDTALQQTDMYASLTNGTDISPLLLNCNIVVGNPIHSNENYTAHVKIYDQKGDGTFIATLDFSVVPNGQINIESEKLSCQEIYLFSGERSTAIVDNKATFNEHIYLLFEGMEGVETLDGKCQIGLSILARDNSGAVIINEGDLFSGQEFSLEEIKTQIAPNIIINEGALSNPVYLEVNIWDKRGEGKIKSWVKLIIE